MCVFRSINNNFGKLTFASVWWSGARDYKNAITNHLFLFTSAEFYRRKKDQRYLDNAKKVGLQIFAAPRWLTFPNRLGTGSRAPTCAMAMVSGMMV